MLATIHGRRQPLRMDREGLEQLITLADRRDEKRYTWLRHLMLLAVGALTLLVSFQAGTPLPAMPLWCLRVAWAALGLGILALGVALHAEVWTADALARRRAASLAASASPSVATIVRRPFIYAWSERVAYALLAISVVALVLHAVTR